MCEVKYIWRFIMALFVQLMNDTRKHNTIIPDNDKVERFDPV
jgi:hypothetical protein